MVAIVLSGDMSAWLSAQPIIISATLTSNATLCKNVSLDKIKELFPALSEDHKKMISRQCIQMVYTELYNINSSLFARSIFHY